MFWIRNKENSFLICTFIRRPVSDNYSHTPDLNLHCFYPSVFIWDFGKLPFPTHLGKYFIKIGKIGAKIHEIGKIKTIFGLGMTPIYGLKNGQIKSQYPCEIIVSHIPPRACGKDKNEQPHLNRMLAACQCHNV